MMPLRASSDDRAQMRPGAQVQSSGHWRWARRMPASSATIGSSSLVLAMAQRLHAAYHGACPMLAAHGPYHFRHALAAAAAASAVAPRAAAAGLAIARRAVAAGGALRSYRRAAHQ